MAFIENLSQQFFHFIFYLMEKFVCHILTTFKKHSPSGFHATIHLLKLAGKRYTAEVVEVFETQI